MVSEKRIEVHSCLQLNLLLKKTSTQLLITRFSLFYCKSSFSDQRIERGLTSPAGISFGGEIMPLVSLSCCRRLLHPIVFRNPRVSLLTIDPFVCQKRERIRTCVRKEVKIRDKSLSTQNVICCFCWESDRLSDGHSKQHGRSLVAVVVEMPRQSVVEEVAGTVEDLVMKHGREYVKNLWRQNDDGDAVMSAFDAVTTFDESVFQEAVEDAVEVLQSMECWDDEVSNGLQSFSLWVVVVQLQVSHKSVEWMRRWRLDWDCLQSCSQTREDFLQDGDLSDGMRYESRVTLGVNSNRSRQCPWLSCNEIHLRSYTRA